MPTSAARASPTTAPRSVSPTAVQNTALGRRSLAAEKTEPGDGRASWLNQPDCATSHHTATAATKLDPCHSRVQSRVGETLEPFAGREVRSRSGFSASAMVGLSLSWARAFLRRACERTYL